MIIDIHIHTAEFSDDSILPVEEAILKAKALHLGGICITDHGSMGILEIAGKLSRKYGILVIPGVEVLTDMGDILVFGARNIPMSDIGAEELIAEVSQKGGVTVSAHPFRDNGRGMGERMRTTAGLSAVEVLNGRTKDIHNSMASLVAAEMKLPSMGGSDAHTQQEVGRCATMLPDDVSSETDFINAIKSGRVAPVSSAEGYAPRPVVPFLITPEYGRSRIKDPTPSL